MSIHEDAGRKDGRKQPEIGGVRDLRDIEMGQPVLRGSAHRSAKGVYRLVDEV